MAGIWGTLFCSAKGNIVLHCLSFSTSPIVLEMLSLYLKLQALEQKAGTSREALTQDSGKRKICHPVSASPPPLQ